MHKGMVIAVTDKSQHLLQLINAVRRHDPRILIEKIRKPADQASQKTIQRKVSDPGRLLRSVENPV